MKGVREGAAISYWFLTSNLSYILNSIPSEHLPVLSAFNVLQIFSLVGVILSRRKLFLAIYGLIFIGSVFTLNYLIVEDRGLRYFSIINSFLILFFLNPTKDEPI